MKTIISTAVLTLLTISFVQAQTPTNGSSTRNQTIQKGKVLRKTATVKSAYHANGGTRVNNAPKHSLTAAAPRTQPIVTKPLPPSQTQP
jgi:hypothetical protein